MLMNYSHGIIHIMMFFMLSIMGGKLITKWIIKIIVLFKILENLI